ncbi:hypothetical protein M2459_000444 [Parabacteroides sp. PF5-5]|uniref:winged helix-turn-helix domain-containing protein n=1 Tax=unclassified Parabacteroides TaxID=2649774 RepID=UPI002472F148|nr:MULTISPECIES: winged helix-turn-helix domain-containing protein [unclassified Parabacteroides]MDH6303622.1 hypothetical protein [Parabacteroides sp. PH5-39]MDH6314944.1 hypothetical protein [Parabacteroides sp. PF5-13]MDH6318281.1 hypothetical protein [Parabacteroides sp. PH5-13]MDH6321786.1 hypothetical protein [Parabacteroides sp. PH5-8]MDH6325910.1 hypothetical protein [Parabacteroides sp. PH5-41]
MIKNEIGLSAGDLYSLLSQKGSLSLRKIGELTRNKESVIYLTIGWLLRENKISVIEQNGEWVFELKESLSNIYY